MLCGGLPVAPSPAARRWERFADFIQAETAKWRKVTYDAGIVAE